MSDELDLDVCSPSSSSSCSPNGASSDQQVILVPPHLARVLITTTGDRIKRIARDTQTIIKVWRDEACRRQADPMKVLIIGRPRNRRTAAKDVNDLIHGIDGNLDKLVENLALGNEIRTNGCTGWEQAVRIPGCLVKSLIGPNGQNIRELAGFTNATLKVERHKDGRARVMISGTNAAKLDAKKKILQFLERYEQKQTTVEEGRVSESNLKDVAVVKSAPWKDDCDVEWDRARVHIEEMKRALVCGGAVSCKAPPKARPKPVLLSSNLAQHAHMANQNARPLYPPSSGYTSSAMRAPLPGDEYIPDDTMDSESRSARPQPPQKGAQSKHQAARPPPAPSRPPAPSPRPPPAPMRAPPPPPARPPPPPPKKAPPNPPRFVAHRPPPVPEPEPFLVDTSVPALPSAIELEQLEKLYDEESDWEEIEGLEEVDEWVPEGEAGLEWEPKVRGQDDDEYDPFNTLPSDEDSDADVALLNAAWDILSDADPVVQGTAIDDVMVNTADADYACTPCFPDFGCPPSPRSRARPARKPREPSASPQSIAAAIAASLDSFGPAPAEPPSKKQRT